MFSNIFFYHLSIFKLHLFKILTKWCLIYYYSLYQYIIIVSTNYVIIDSLVPS